MQAKKRASTTRLVAHLVIAILSPPPHERSDERRRKNAAQHDQQLPAHPNLLQETRRTACGFFARSVLLLIALFKFDVTNMLDIAQPLLGTFRFFGGKW